LKIQLENNQVPLALSDYPSNWQCGYCQFKEVCQLAGREMLDWNTFKERIIAENQ